MQLASVRIFVTDLEAAARFYRDVVGGILLHARDPSDNTITFLQVE
jgi:catechol 2,3-dioxygenase-like lactoylglutathione lyase family enzyme